MLENNISFLQQKLRSKDELIKSLMDAQTMVLETISKQNQFKRPDKNLSNVLMHHHNNYIEKVHHTSQHEQRSIQEQHFNLEQKPQSPSNSTMKEHSKNNCQSEKTHNKTQKVKAKKIYIENLNENITNEDIYKLFGLKTTEYLHQTSSVKMSGKAEITRGFGFVTVPEFVSTQLIELNGVEFHGKTILIEEARSQPTQSLNFDTRLRNTQNPQNLRPSKEPQKNPPPIPPKQNTYNNY